MGKTSIEWSADSVNPLIAFNVDEKRGWFCEKIAAGCKNCYAERMNQWRGNGVRYAADQAAKVTMKLDEKLLRKIAGFKKPRKIFPCDMTDLFGRWVPDEWIDAVLAAFYGLPERFEIQFLTKRAARMQEYMAAPDRRQKVLKAGFGLGLRWALAGTQSLVESPAAWPPPHFQFGVSVACQEDVEIQIPAMLRTPAALRWVSYEPAIGPADIFKYLSPMCPFSKDEHKRHQNGNLICDYRKIDWVVCGSESGPGRRPWKLEWFEKVVQDCTEAGVPVFVKQLTDASGYRIPFEQWPTNLQVRQFPMKA